MSKSGKNLNIICLESQALYELIDEVVAYVKSQNLPTAKRWLNDTEAMELLGVTSKTTMQKYRDEGKIRFTQPSRKVILYDRESIMTFLEKHAQDTF